MYERSLFETMLNEIESPDPEVSAPASRNPFATAPPFVWTADAAPRSQRGYEDIPFAEPDPAPHAAALADDIDSIRRELALPAEPTRAALDAARRRFMWVHHPDRWPEAMRDSATRRVAIANMLIDRALGDLLRRKA